MKFFLEIIKGIFGALLVFLLGFGMMFLLWKVIGNPNDLPGLFYYRAATFGDGICLPILVGSGIVFLQINKQSIGSRKKQGIILVAAIVACLIAAAMQASWLLRDDTVLNWSIPIQHHFNLAGWYHSLFFIGMFGAVTYLICSIWNVLKNKQEESSYLDYVLFMLFSFAGALFLFMHITDDYNKYLSTELLICICAILSYVLLGIYIWSAKNKANKKIWSAMSMGIESAYCIAVLICIPTKGNIAFALAAGLCVCFLWKIENFTFTQMILQDFWTTVIHMGLIYVLTGITSIKEQVLICIPFILMIVANEYLHNEQIEWRFFSIGLIVIYLIISNLLLIDKDVNTIKNFLFSLAALFLFKKEMRRYFEDLMREEANRNDQGIEKGGFRSIKKKVYLQIIIGIISALLVLAHWINDLTKNSQYHVEIGSIQSSRWIVILLIVQLGLLGIMCLPNLRKSKYIKWFSIFVTFAVYITSLYLIWSIIDDYMPVEWDTMRWSLLICSICACIGASLLLAHGYYMNMVLLRGKTKDVFVGVTANLLFLESLVFNFSVVILILCKCTWMNWVVICSLEIALYIVVPFLLSNIQQLQWKEPKVKGNTPSGGIAQDGLMITVLMLLGIGLPRMYIPMINFSIISLASITEWISGAALICTAFRPIGFCLENNVKYMERQKKEYEKIPQGEEQWEILHRCLVRQSKQTVFAMMPYICIAVGRCVIARCVQSKPEKEIIPDIYSKYIDAEKYQNKKLNHERRQ